MLRAVFSAWQRAADARVFCTRIEGAGQAGLLVFVPQESVLARFSLCFLVFCLACCGLSGEGFCGVFPDIFCRISG